MGRDSGENFHRASGGVVMYIIPFRFTPEVMAFIAKNTAAQSLTAMRNKTLTPERRREIAVRAAKKRWESANA